MQTNQPYLKDDSLSIHSWFPLPPSGLKKPVPATLRGHTKLNYCTFLQAQENSSAAWHIKGLIWNINKEDRVKGIPSRRHIQSFQWAKPLQGRESPHVITPNKPKWPTRQNEAWQGWRGDTREKWVLSDLFHQVCLQVVSWQISAKWSEGATGPSVVGEDNGDSDVVDYVVLLCPGRCLQSTSK